MWPTLCFVHCFMGNSFSATVEFIPRSRWEVALLYKNTIYEGTDPNAHILCVRHRPMRTNGAVSIFFRHTTYDMRIAISTSQEQEASWRHVVMYHRH